MTDLPRPAPEFSLPKNGGGTVALSDLSGGCVLFFYPRDNTPGCTTEALDFTAQLAAFTDLGLRVLGLSRDSIKKHENFVAKHDLGVDLLADLTGETCENYGVWKEKKLYGKLHWGIERSTFLIAPDKTIIAEWRGVKVPGHVDAVLATAQEHFA